MKQAQWTLDDRPRLMAQVFALKLLVLGHYLVVFSVILMFLRLTPSKEVESLFFLFSCFLSIVALVLLLIRFQAHSNRALMASPISLFLAPSLNYQILALCFSALAVLEALAREARMFSTGSGFRICQIMVLASWIGLVFLKPPDAMILFFLAMFLLCLASGYGCRAWIQGLRRAMDSLDSDTD